MYNVFWFHSVFVLFSARRVMQRCLCSKKNPTDVTDVWVGEVAAGLRH